MKVIITLTISPDVVKEIDKLARELGVSRSRLVEYALERLLEEWLENPEKIREVKA